ncbi:MAG: superoxide dismutase [Leptospirales bacterium]
MFPGEMPELPYKTFDLEPYISEKTVSFHYGKHHKAYMEKALAMLPGSAYESLPVKEILTKATLDRSASGLFNNVAQVWNHDFYWKSMKPKGGGEPQGNIRKMIERDFGSFDKFKEDFAVAGATQFGSGWVWLVEDGGKLEIVKTANAQNPIADGQKPLLTMDVWEHAYYLDFQNRRPDYIKIYLEYLVNWDFAESNL